MSENSAPNTDSNCYERAEPDRQKFPSKRPLHDPLDDHTVILPRGIESYEALRRDGARAIRLTEQFKMINDTLKGTKIVETSINGNECWHSVFPYGINETADPVCANDSCHTMLMCLGCAFTQCMDCRDDSIMYSCKKCAKFDYCAKCMLRAHLGKEKLMQYPVVKIVEADDLSHTDTVTVKRLREQASGMNELIILD